MAKANKKGAGGGGRGAKAPGQRDIVMLMVINFSLGWLLRSESPAFFGIWLDVAMGAVGLAAGLAMMGSIVKSAGREVAQRHAEAQGMAYGALPPPGN